LSIAPEGDAHVQGQSLTDLDHILAVEDTLVPDDQLPNLVQRLQKAGFQMVEVGDTSKHRKALLNLEAGVLPRNPVLQGYMLELQEEMRRELLCEV